MGYKKYRLAVRTDRKLHHAYSNPNLNLKQARKAVNRIYKIFNKKDKKLRKERKKKKIRI